MALQRTLVPVRDEEAAGSNPATLTSIPAGQNPHQKGGTLREQETGHLKETKEHEGTPGKAEADFDGQKDIPAGCHQVCRERIPYRVPAGYCRLINSRRYQLTNGSCFPRSGRQLSIAKMVGGLPTDLADRVPTTWRGANLGRPHQLGGGSQRRAEDSVHHRVYDRPSAATPATPRRHLE